MPLISPLMPVPHDAITPLSINDWTPVMTHNQQHYNLRSSNRRLALTIGTVMQFPAIHSLLNWTICTGFPPWNCLPAKLHHF